MDGDRAGRLMQSLLYEGYALYPYTPGATKNSTPTPFGILYPPAYAALQPAAFSHLQCEAVVEPAESSPAVRLEIRFLQPSGPRHQAVERRVDVPELALAALEASPMVVEFTFALEAGETDPERASRGAVALSVQPLDEGRFRLRVRLENRTRLDRDAATLDRPGALVHSFLSAHVLARVRGAAFVSPLEREGARGEAAAACVNENTWPVLANEGDDALLGAAILLPDHPELAPESQVNFFDHTEIEEALLLHVHALSDGERDAIGDQDPAVREMLQRALAATPADLLSLHAMMKPSSVLGGARPAPVVMAEPSLSAIDAGGIAVADPGENFRYMTRSREEPRDGESEATIAGTVVHPGQRVRLRLPAGAGVHERMYDGRSGTIHRILVDDQGRTHLGMTFDDDPGRELMRDTNRLLYFFPEEIEILP